MPQGLGRVEGGAHLLADQLAQCPVVARCRQRDVADVLVDVETRLVLPVRLAAARARPHNALVEAAEGRKALVEEDAQALDVGLAVEHQDTGDHHQVGWVFHPQPGRVDARHRDEPGHRGVIVGRSA